MKLALLGTGMIVRELLSVLEELGISPYALLGREGHRERGEELARRHHIPHLYFDYEQLLEGEADTVYIGLPNGVHFEYARAALLKNKHVIVEKPMVLTTGEFTELRALAQERGLILVEAMTLHYLPALRQMREDLSLLGRIRLSVFNYSQYSSRYDAFLRGEIAPAFDPALGGGALMDLNVYNLHAALYLFGLPRAADYVPNMGRGVDTSGVLTLDYGEMKTVCLAAKDCQGPNRSLITGERGWLELQGPLSVGPDYSVTLRSGETLRREFPRDVHRMAPEFRIIRDMVDNVRLDLAEEFLDISGGAVKILDQVRPY
ncbi:MAG: Gfo/Idh/MocA family oxidoreductase [Oscillospiraceae bacterium]|jgi:predicted dehydrogenase|nr:Gfo/Idh/MocA family oxidoreductase [Oscillospiraceae bacterium]